MLITLGSLFAIDYYAGVPFTRTWPLLLIAFGLMKLLERAALRSAHDSDYDPGPPFVGGSV
ncbi:MAG TPA: hypothetical protein VN428_19025 [Bryobacteraceae bacterium]|nr:hypothetical protein [Bryobacteraceae bacterium]